MKTLRIFGLCVTSVLLSYSSTVADNTVAIETSSVETNAGSKVESTPTVTSAAVAAAPATPEPIEIAWIETDIQSVLRSLAAKAGTNLIMGDEVTGKVTVNLKGVSYEEAMQLIAESKGYAYVKDKSVVKIKSRESLEVEPVELRTVILNYAKADDVKKTLDGIVTKQGKIQVDTRANMLVLSDTPSSMTKLLPLIQALDTQTPQVLIEAKFVETTRNPKKDLGVNWSGTLLDHQVAAGGSVLKDGSISGDPKAIVSPVNQPVSGFQWAKAAGSSMTSPWQAGLAVLDAGSASLIFSYLSQDNDSELLANPRVVTTDNSKARISIATQFPIPNFSFSEQTASLQINGFEYKDIGIILNVLPRINKDDFVTLEVTPEASSSTENATLQSGGGSAVLIPIINTRTATTTVLIKSGNTLAIGGLMRQDSSDNYTKVPLIGDAPLIGPFFRSKSLSKTKRDLLIFLTPTIVRPESQTGYENLVGGIPHQEVYTNDKWLPRDNAKPKMRNLPNALSPNPPGSKTPTRNFDSK